MDNSARHAQDVTRTEGSRHPREDAHDDAHDDANEDAHEGADADERRTAVPTGSPPDRDGRSPRLGAQPG
ncbi:hypothetical protein AB0M11_19050 [Streptomyces sp. NPDC051987]|uniref:hypothetical protein n=1 Tax=Streptomyces sp. NPDC051987 TaxID=3155808 RepID=UPI00342FD454